LWPVYLPGADGKVNEWHRAAAQAAELAMTKWVRIKANMVVKTYDIYEAVSDLSEPVWPTQPLHELLSIGFRDKLVDNLDHPLLKRIRGEN
jgi:hypothetical protein